MDYNDESDEPTLVLEQTQIHNSSFVGLWAKTAHLRASNSVFGNAGNASFYGNIGGDYEFTHCTFSNYWNRSFRSTPAVLLNDFAPISETENYVKPLKKALFANCLIDGNQNIEFLVEQRGEVALKFSLDHTAIRFAPSDQSIYEDPYYDFTDTTFYQKLFRNKISAVNNPNDNDFRITQYSEVIRLGKPVYASEFPTDIVGVNRLESVDLGAYQHIIIEED
jgi:hypothetical protein